MKNVVLRLACLVLVPVAGLGHAQAQSWTWVMGHSDSIEDPSAYEAYCKRIYDYYQDRNMLLGELVTEETLEGAPEGEVVYIGPLSAFDNSDWLAPHFPAPSARPLRFHGIELQDANTGIYLKSEDERTIYYTGLSRKGFESIFTTPTGSRDCTIMVGGKLQYEGDFKAGDLQLTHLEFLRRYPSPTSLADLAPYEGALEVEPYYGSEESRELSAVSRRMLNQLTRGQRVLFVGENHWNVGVNEGFLPLLDHLLEVAPVRSVFFEFNYSFSAFWNHYVHLDDEAEARAFREGPLHNLVNADTQMAYLERLRRWNLEHPKAPVSVGCLDMEWSAADMLYNVVRPFMRHFEPDWEIGRGTPDALPRTLDEISELLEILVEEDAEGPYPFLTPRYMQTVITNLRDTLAIQDHSVDRQRGILRNITEFHGDLMQSGLVVFKGGGWHAIKNSKDEGFQREATFLDQEYGPTRGKVKTLMLHGLGVGFEEVSHLNMQRLLPHATNYRNLVRGYQDGLANGRASRGQHYLLNSGSPTPFERLVARKGYQVGQDALWILKVDEEKLAGSNIPSDSHPLKRYDAVVYFLRSQLEPIREELP